MAQGVESCRHLHRPHTVGDVGANWTKLRRARGNRNTPGARPFDSCPKAFLSFEGAVPYVNLRFLAVALALAFIPLPALAEEDDASHVRVEFPGDVVAVTPERPQQTVLAAVNDAGVGVELAVLVKDTPVGWVAKLAEQRFKLASGDRIEIMLTVGAARDAAREGRVLVRWEASNGDHGLVEVPVHWKAPEQPPSPPANQTQTHAPEPREDSPLRKFHECIGPARQAQPGSAEEARAMREEEVRRFKECCAEYKDSPLVAEKCRALAEVKEHLVAPRFVTFKPFEDGFGFEEYRVTGILAIERLRYEDGQAVLERRGEAVQWKFADGSMVSRDNPTGLLVFEGPGKLTVRFADGVQIKPRAESKEGMQAYSILADGWKGSLMTRNAVVEGRTVVVVNGTFSFHLLPPEPPGKMLAPPRQALEADIKSGIDKGAVGAEVSVRAKQPSDTKAQDRVTVFAYDDVAVKVEVPERAATRDNPVWIEVGANLSEGRTIVLDVDASLFASTKKSDLLVRYFDVQYVGGVREQVEVVFREASSLEDVLDATDDGLQPEYWIVADAQGLHVLVSVPTWSIHAISIASIVEFVTQPSVLSGIIAGVAGSALAAVALMWPRRRKEM
jgi:putative ubiquitin-RnfH superfamily antitoxin RatB of RatAB toxin-antitoxin module